MIGGQASRSSVEIGTPTLDAPTHPEVSDPVPLSCRPRSRTYMYRVVVVMPNCRPRSCAWVSREAMARIAMRSMAPSILRGRPPRRLQARAAAKPVRSAINSCSNSASNANLPKTKRPLAVAGGGLGVGASEHPQAGAAGVQFVQCCHQMFQVAPQTVKLPDHEGIARLLGLEASTGRGDTPCAPMHGPRRCVPPQGRRRAGRRAAGRGVGCRLPWRLSRSQSALPSAPPFRIDGAHHARLRRKIQRVFLRGLVGFRTLLEETRKPSFFGRKQA